MEIFSQAGAIVLSRWAHFLSGITWIGILYYFNFVQVPSFGQFEAGARTEAISKLVPRALWWFRWGAVLTLLSGISILGFQEQMDGDYLASSQGTAILTGIVLAVVMFTNVWMVIWPNQRIVIASAQRVAGGGEADPAAAPAGRRALLASRTNTFFSIPMLFFMAATAHFSPGGVADAGARTVYWIIALGIMAAAEANALGLFGGFGPAPQRKFLEAHRDTIIAGFVLWAVLYSSWDLTF